MFFDVINLIINFSCLERKVSKKFFSKSIFHLSFSAKERWRKENSRMEKYGDKLLAHSLKFANSPALGGLKHANLFNAHFAADLYRRPSYVRGECGMQMYFVFYFDHSG